MTKAHATAIADLEALGVDSAELRWLATRDYLDDQAEEVSRKINALFLIIEFLDRAEANAIRRGAPASTFDSWHPPGSKQRAWMDAHGIGDNGTYGPRLVAADYLTARSAVLERYEGKARARAIEILNEYVPLDLRVSNANIGSKK
jgi:hypothetical protein